MTEDTIIVGAGPIGLACAISAKRRGIDPLVIDAGAVVDSVTRYPTGMSFFTTPDLLEIGRHPLVCSGAKPTREEALMYYRGVVRTEGLRVQTYTKLLDATRTDSGIECAVETRTGRGSFTCARLILATGYFNHTNRLDVPGDDLPHVRYYFDEAHLSFNLDVVVIGGKNSAVEAALQLYRAGARTTLVYRGDEFPPGVKYWMRPDIENRIRAGEIAGCLGTDVVAIEESSVVVRPKGGEERSIPADRVYALIGFRPNSELFRGIGVEIDDQTGRPTLNQDTFETNVSGVYMAGSIKAGFKTSEIFIENGRFDGERIFGER